MHTNVDEIRNAIDKLNEIDRDDYGDLSLRIAAEAESECYENDKELHSLLNAYYTDDKALRIINETLVCVCGWGIESLVDYITED